MLWAQRPDGRCIKFTWNASANRYDEDKAQPVAYIVKEPDQSYTLHGEDRTVERYNSFGYALEVKNRQGLGWTFTYYSLNYLARVTHTSGRYVEFTWANGRVSDVRDPAGRMYTLYRHRLLRHGRGQRWRKRG